MGRKPKYIRAWRQKRGHTLADMVGRLEAIGVSITEASLSRIERGVQPYSQDILEAIAVALDVNDWQLLRDDPEKEGELVDFMAHRLDAEERKRAIAVLEAMFGERAR
jgi:transcriptional regulator with XRE-family HTH domain